MDATRPKQRTIVTREGTPMSMAGAWHQSVVLTCGHRTTVTQLCYDGVLARKSAECGRCTLPDSPRWKLGELCD